MTLLQRLIAYGVLAAALAGGVAYFRHLAIQNRAQKAEIAALKASAVITHKQQEVSDRVQIELDDLREKNRKLADGLNRDLADWLRKPPSVPPIAGASPGPDAASTEHGESAATARPDAIAGICAPSAVESDDRADTIAAWQKWYAEIKALRQ